MASLFDLFDPKLQPSVPHPQSDALDILQGNLDATRAGMTAQSRTGDTLVTAVSRHDRRRIMESHSGRSRRPLAAGQALIEGLRVFQSAGRLPEAFAE